MALFPSLSRLFELVADQRPDAIAVSMGDRSLPYRELDERANFLAHRLISEGVGPDRTVAISLERSLEMAVAVLAVIKAGGAYVPVDPNYPADRVAFMLADAGPAVVLTRDWITEGRSADRPNVETTSDHLGYVIYTSGSTGQPKGVEMRRGALANLIEWQLADSPAGPGDRTLQFASLSFDVSFQEIFATWASGGELVLVDEVTRRDPATLLALLDARGVRRLFLPFVMLQYLAEASNESGIRPRNLGEVITAGEQLLITPAVRAFFAAMPGCTLANHYGPSETHVVTAHLLDGDPATWPDVPPIGRPIANCRVVIVDEAMQPATEGELLAAGVCLARGYRNRPDLTAERFVTLDGERAYRTGDLARRRDDGVVEFLGRKDQQVKIRGHRVEPGEVEVALSRVPGVREGVVVVREDSPGDRRLVAYFAGCTPDAVRAALRESLPEYMLPAAFVAVDSFPLTPSGKVDRRALPAPNSASPTETLSEAERTVAEVWADVLKIAPPGRDANFFEVGGHSLAAVRVHAKLRQKIGRDFPLVALFEHPTVAKLAAFLTTAEVPIAPAPVVRPATNDAIAIVGMAGRFPGADDVDAFWRNLATGVESVRFFTDEELAGAGIDPQYYQRPEYVAARAILDKPEYFDAAFFGYTPREAELIDPQHRLFLETCWGALEHSGYDPARYSGAIGVWAGASLNTYLIANICSRPEVREAFVRAFQVGEYATLLGNDKDYLATRVSYKLNLRGPSMSVQTACSTSLVAVCQAVDSLLAGRCDMALAGGVSVSFPQQRGYLFQEGNIASADGHCRPFDAAASGTVFGEGVGVVVLKRLADAIADGDTIHAVIKGVAVNNDGAGKVSYMAPSVDGQADAVVQAHARAGIDPRSISYVEAHGTGTPIGDPIEVASLTKAFRAATADTGFCAIGSVKSNVGHLESAAGVTGLIKTTLAIANRQIPPTLHYERPNSAIDFAGSPFYVNDRLTDWQGMRRAAVNSLGVGGTNAHVVLEEAPSPPPADESTSPQLLILSARTPEALDAATANLRAHLDAHPEQPLADVAWTLQIGRHRFAERRFAVATERGELAFTSGKAPPAAPAVAFLFPGQGSQYGGMAKGLYDAEPFFRERIDECAAFLEPLLNVDLRAVMFGDDSRLNETHLTQPALFVIEYSLARLWMDRGVRPAVMLGHSVGEFAAAVLAGVFQLEDALTIVARRAQLIQSLEGGAMLAVRASEAEVRPLLDVRRSLAAVNGASQCVVSGTREAVAELEHDLAERKVACRVLATSHAFHSPMMDPILDAFTDAVAKVERRAPSLPFVSSLTGTWITAEQATDPRYWADHLRQTVRFAAGLQALRERRPDVLLEVGPGQTLASLARQSADRSRGEAILNSLPPPQDKAGDRELWLSAAGRLWLAGAELDWQRIHAPHARRRVPLPSYPFQRQRFWVEAACSTPAAQPEPSAMDYHLNGNGHHAVTKDDAPPAGSRRERLADELRFLFADLAGSDAANIDPAIDFLELGFDSLFLTQAVLAIQNKFGVRVSFRDVLDEYHTVELLAGHIDNLAPKPAPVPVARQTTPQTPPPPVADETIRRMMTVQAELMQQQIELLRLFTRPPAAPPATPAPAARAEQAITQPAPAPFSPFRPADKVVPEEFTPAQRAFIDAIIARTVKRTGESKRQTQLHRAHHADPRTVSGFTRAWKEMVYPIVVHRSLGSKLWDVDGNEYIDLVNGFGPVLLGHSFSPVVAAAEKQLKAGFEVGPQTPLAGQVAKLVCELTGNERASFVCTGSEAVYGALRAARTATGRDKVVLFARDYHGNFDEVLVRAANAGGALRSFPSAPGVPRSAVGNVIVLDYGTPQSLEVIREQAGELAAVLVEPVQSRRPELQPREFLRELRRITEQAGACLIFDEVITGFRIHQGGAQAYFDIRADLCTYGKVVAGGMPVGVVAGKAAFMDTFDGGMWEYGDDSMPEAGRTFFAGTFVRHPLAMAAAFALLTHLKTTGPQLQDALNRRADYLVGKLDALLTRADAPVKVVNCGSLMYFRMAEGSKGAALLFYLLREQGVYLLEGFPSYLTTAHTDADIEKIIRAFEYAVAALRDGGFLGASSAAPPASLEAIPAIGPFAPLAETVPVDGATDAVPLTEAQTELWIASRMGPDASAAFNESCSLLLHGAFDPDALREAVAQLVARHESLRSIFGTTEPVQYVLASAPIDIPLLDFSDLPPADRERAVADILDAEARTPFDLTTGPVVRVKIIRRSPDEHLVSLTLHHIVCDGWSYDILLHELGECYAANVRGDLAGLAPAKPFREYAAEERAWLASPEAARVEKFWLDRFATPPTPLELPADRQRPTRRTHAGDRASFPFGEELAGRVRDGAKRLGSTPYQVLFTAYQVLLHRLTGNEDIVVGIPSAGQSLAGSKTLVGHCVHFLPVRVSVTPRTALADLVRRTRSAMLDVFEHRPFTYVTLLRKLNLGRSPLVSATFNLDPAITDLDFGALRWEILKNPKPFVVFDLHFNVVDTGRDLVLEAEYNTDLFDRATIDRWAGVYRLLVEQLLATPTTACGDAAVLRPEEYHQIVVGWNPSPSDYLRGTCVHQRFEAQAAATPDAVALAHGDESMTYAELNRRANQIAHRLGTVSPDTPVAMCIKRSPASVAAMLGILKAGGAYLPLDPTYPDDRLAFMLRDAGAKVVVADAEHATRFRDVEIVCPDACAGPDGNPTSAATPDSLAYIIYTSGSTGVPKGVAVPHRGVMRLLFGTDYVPLGEETVTGHIASELFDATTFELWGALLHGGRVALYDRESLAIADLAGFLKKHHVNTMFASAGLFNTVVDIDASAFEGVRWLLVGGEALSPSHIRRAAEALPNTNLSNGYGPTETTTFAVCHAIPKTDIPDPIPIGRPIGNTFVVVVDRNRKPVPVGVVGELLIGGPGVARGYLNRPELTAEKFVASPVPEFAGQPFYRTGDLVRWLPDGVIEFVARNDDQVKVRGFRIELGEVENAMARHPGVVRAVAAVRRLSKASGDLIGYYVAKPGTQVTAEGLREFLQSKLPSYMVPTRFVVLKQVPLNRNGKVDRAALLSPSAGDEDRAIVAPRDDIERELHAIWSRVLGAERLGVTDDFFDLGGHSLKAAELIAAVHKEMGHTLPLGTLFAAPTVERMARVIRERIETHSDSPLVPFTKTGKKPPLFLVSGVGGHVFTFTQLARQLGGDQPTYGLKAVGIDGGVGPVDTIEEMARVYVAAILQERPRGPFVLGGYSAGGMVALETALQLQEAGHEVPLLAIFDGAAPGYGMLPFWQRLKVHAGAVIRPRGVSRWGYVRQRFANLRHRLLWKMGFGGWMAKALTGEGVIPDDTLKRVRLAALNASKNYRPTATFAGKVVLFRAEILEDWDVLTVDDPLLGWPSWHKGAMETHSFPVPHLELFTEPNVDRLAALVAAEIGRLR